MGGGMDYKCRLVTLSTVRHRSEIRSIGFKHCPIKADNRQHITQLGILKRYNTVYSEIEIAYFLIRSTSSAVPPKL